MKEHNDEVPQAMRIRQEIQESMNNSLPEKKFRKEKIDVVEIDIELDNLGFPQLQDFEPDRHPFRPMGHPRVSG